MPTKSVIASASSASARFSAPCRAVVVLVASVALAVLTAVPSGSARELDDRKERVERQIERTEEHLARSSAQLLSSTQRLTEAVTALDEARISLAESRGELALAKVLDRELQDQLAEAVEDLSRARAALARGRTSVSEREEALRTIAVQQYASGGSELMALSTVFNSQDPAQLAGQLNSHKNVLDKEAATLARLEASRVMLTVQASAYETAKQEVAERRAVAAENLARTAELESQAEQTQAHIRDLVVIRREARQAAATAKAEDLRRLRQFQEERDHISALLKRRAEEARARAEAADRARAAAATRAHAKATAERAANAKTAARRRAAAAAENESTAEQEGQSEKSTTRSHSAPLQAPPTSPSGLTYPVDGYVTSSYGMRLHPVYKRWSLHDGTDFGASCGTPIRAASTGTVIGMYYDNAYGNRVIIDHGLAGGVGLGTSYNHMSAFSAYVGQTVRRGEVIGYVGTTGYSTGCHLHFMVFENGVTVDPLTWL